MLLQLHFGLGQGVDLVFLGLQVIQRLLVGLLKGLLLLGQLDNGLIQPGHLLCEVLDLRGEKHQDDFLVSKRTFCPIVRLDRSQEMCGNPG